jgi:hypothetical protein
MHSLTPSKISTSLQSSVTAEIVEGTSPSTGNISDVTVLSKTVADHCNSAVTFTDINTVVCNWLECILQTTRGGPPRMTHIEGRDIFSSLDSRTSTDVIFLCIKADNGNETSIVEVSSVDWH